MSTNNETLKTIAKATKANGHTFIPAEHAAELVNAGLIEVNPELKNDQGHVAVRATEALYSKLKPTFEITMGLDVPAVKRTQFAPTPEKYPFSKLELGGSFFIPATEDVPEPSKKYASAVAAAVKRFHVETGGTKANRKGEAVPATEATRKFVIRAVTAGQTYSNGFVEPTTGARVFRTL